MNKFRSLSVGIVLASALGIALIAPAGSAQAATDSHNVVVTNKTQAHRQVVQLKKETDSVVTLVNMDYETDVTNSFLDQVGLDPDDGWVICFVTPSQHEPYNAYAYTMGNRMYASAWMYDLKEGNTELAGTVLVQACTHTQITEPLRMSVMAYQPMLPDLAIYPTKHACVVQMTGRDSIFSSWMSVTDYTKDGFYRSRDIPAGAVQSKKIVLGRNAPDTLGIYEGIYADYAFDAANGVGMALTTYILDVRNCVATADYSTYPVG